MNPQPPETSTQEVLAGLVERVSYHNAENGFCVLRAKARGHRDVVTVVGYAAAIGAGEWITASGDWVNDRTHGQQFKTRFLRTSPPTSADGIEKYLSSGMIRGGGPVYAKKLVRAFGEKVFDIIETTPDRLREVDGIGPVRAASILAAWAEQKAVREIMIFLHSHGVGTERAVRIFKTYGADAIQVMTENPYRLTRGNPRAGGGTDFQALWCRRHPGHDREPVPARARHPRHRFQDRRRDRHEAWHRKVSDDPGSCGDFLRADRSDGRGPLRFADRRAGAAGREATPGAAATDPDCARPRAARGHGD